MVRFPAGKDAYTTILSHSRGNNEKTRLGQVGLFRYRTKAASGLETPLRGVRSRIDVDDVEGGAGVGSGEVRRRGDLRERASASRSRHAAPELDDQAARLVLVAAMSSATISRASDALDRSTQYSG